MTESKQYYYVYKLFNPDCSDFYIGSTINMKLRMNNHKYHCNNENAIQYNFKVYRYIRSNGGYDKWQFEVLEHIRNSINIKDLHGLERKYIEQLKPSLNIQKPNRTKAQYYQDNKEEITSKRALYYQNNKEAFKQYYQNNKEAIRTKNKKFECPCGGRYQLNNTAQHMNTKKHKAFIQ